MGATKSKHSPAQVMTELNPADLRQYFIPRMEYIYTIGVGMTAADRHIKICLTSQWDISDEKKDEEIKNLVGWEQVARLYRYNLDHWKIAAILVWINKYQWDKIILEVKYNTFDHAIRYAYRRKYSKEVYRQTIVPVHYELPDIPGPPKFLACSA